MLKWTDQPCETDADSGNLRVTAENIREAFRRGREFYLGIAPGQSPYWDEWGPDDNPGT